ncbi:polysaccharide deacetylase family protein [Sporomusa sp.]|uniref:polysaccharide deacetylase family protein n=1 Tax=Sporomusa sp. TaxID=2078658 RepID=UPI002B8BD9B8|nr:polysaccharide deacetylase family protein [Sporomusa sp.]HWR44182.1 polysaccharide deacetylase family protein [Sporomusa sp.]
MKRRYLMVCTIALTVALASVSEKHLSDDAQTISKVPTTHKVVALTIDDGPNYKATPEILAVLREKHVRATFFVLGQNVERFPDFLAQEVADGHEIGAHTYSHLSLPKLSPQEISEEFDKAEKAILAIAPKPTLFRPPGGFYNTQVIEIARQRGYTVVLWSIDPKDWSCPPTDRVVEKVLTDIKPGSIILLHDGQYPLPTPKALGIIIDRLRERGYEFVTVSELFQYNEVRHSFSLVNGSF